jgi:hypothetical protein
MGLIQECKPILAQRDRRDLLRFVRDEISDLRKDEVEITAELVIDSLIAKHPVNTYMRPPPKHTTIQWTKNQQRYVGLHPL